jgi:hypothetical protein
MIRRAFLATVLALPAGHALAQGKTEEDKYSKLGFELMEKENIGPLKLKMKEAEVRKLLKEPPKRGREVREAATDNSWVQVWEFPKSGVKLKMRGGQKRGGPKVVDTIEITAPSDFKTARGIGIGSAAADARRAYATEIDPKEAQPKSVVAGTIYGGLVMSVVNNRISAIGLGAFAE